MARPLVTLLDRPVAWTVLDPAAAKIAAVWKKVLPTPVKDVLHGTFLGHPLHPMLVQVPVGTWTSAVLLDAMATVQQARGGDQRARRAVDRASGVLVATGLVGAVPAVLAGWADYIDQHEEQQRIALVHAASNVVGVALFAASLVARRRSRTGRARVLALAGMSANGLGAALGGHLAYRWASGANHAEHVPHTTPAGWYPVVEVNDLPEGAPHQVHVGDTPVVLVRRGDTIHALADTCSHLSAPLSDGQVVREKGRDCIVCPWHASTFDLADGSVVHGPAVSPQPRFDVRLRGTTVQIRVREIPGVPAAEPLPEADTATP